MSHSLVCYRCGHSLAALSLPFSRYDECPSCAMPMKVCRMCNSYDPDVPKKCREDDAEEIPEKERVNFCDWFRPGEDVFDGKAAAQAVQARNSLDALFGDEDDAASGQDAGTQDAEDLFK